MADPAPPNSGEGLTNEVAVSDSDDKVFSTTPAADALALAKETFSEDYDRLGGYYHSL